MIYVKSTLMFKSSKPNESSIFNRNRPYPDTLWL